MKSSSPKVYVVILNYKAWPDTIECLESVYASNYPNFEVVLVDNGSHDASVEKFLSWARGDFRPQPSPDSPLHGPTKPLEIKIPCTLLDEKYVLLSEEAGNASAPPLTVITSETDWGCYGGFNLGLRWCLQRGNFQYAWVLNNDTAVKSDSLTRLVAEAEKSGLGICGARIAYYDRPETVQGLAGRFSLLSGRNCEILDKEGLDRMDYVVGTAMLVSKGCLDTGLLPEEYFLYLEDVDFCYGARTSGIRLGVAFDSVVYHKAGIGSTSAEKEYYFARNLLHFAWKRAPGMLPFSLWYVLVHRVIMKIRTGHFRKVGFLLRGVLDFLRGRMGERR